VVNKALGHLIYLAVWKVCAADWVLVDWRRYFIFLRELELWVLARPSVLKWHFCFLARNRSSWGVPKAKRVFNHPQYST